MNMLLTVKEEGNLPGIEICCTRNLPIRRHISYSMVTSLSNNNPNLRSSPRSTNPSHLPSSSNRAEPYYPLIPQLSVVVQMGTNTSRSISLRSTLIKIKLSEVGSPCSRVSRQECVCCFHRQPGQYHPSTYLHAQAVFGRQHLWQTCPIPSRLWSRPFSHQL